MDLTSAKSELRNPPKVNFHMILSEAVAVVSVAYLMFVFFG